MERASVVNNVSSVIDSHLNGAFIVAKSYYCYYYCLLCRHTKGPLRTNKLKDGPFVHRAATNRAELFEHFD